jgi:hypothetical protein
MLRKLKFTPGIDKEGTQYSADAGWFHCDKIRFRGGRPEKIGGWRKYQGLLQSSPAGVSQSGMVTLAGVVRGLVDWGTSLYGLFVGIGTTLKYYVHGTESDSFYFDVTPLETISDLTGNVDVLEAAPNGESLTLRINDPDHGITQEQIDNYDVYVKILGEKLGTDPLKIINATTVEVTQTAHGLDNGDLVLIKGATAITDVSDITLTAPQVNGIFTVSNKTADTFQITVASNSVTALTTGGGSNITVLPHFGNLARTNPDYSYLDNTQFGGLKVINWVSSDIYDVECGEANLPIPFCFPMTQASSGSRRYRIGYQLDMGVNDQQGFGTSSGTSTSVTWGFGIYNGGVNPSPPPDTLSSGTTAWDAGVSSTPETVYRFRLWSQSPFGDQLIINPRSGGVFIWDSSTFALDKSNNFTIYEAGINLYDPANTYNPLEIDVDTNSYIKPVAPNNYAPQVALQTIVSPVDGHVICFGTNDIGSNVLDPLLIRWSSQENPYMWYPTDQNSAGGQPLTSGSAIIGAIKTRQEILIFTDSSIVSMRFIGGFSVFSFSTISEGISLIGPNAAVSAADSIYFMDYEGFYVYRGGVQRLPCSVLSYVFNGGTYAGQTIPPLNRDQSFKVFGYQNPDESEVTWFYPVGTGATEPSRYVTYNYAQNLWTIGEMDRGMWIHAPTKEYPIAGSCIISPDQNTNYLYDQEYGHKAEGGDLTAYIESGEISIEDGEKFFFMKRVLPDIKAIGSPSGVSLDITFKTSDFSTVTPFSDTVKSITYNVDYTPYSGVTIPSLTPVLNTRVRGREFSMKVENTTSDSGWRMGDFRFDLRTDGRR